MAAKETLFREIGEKCSNNYKLCVILYKDDSQKYKRYSEICKALHKKIC